MKTSITALVLMSSIAFAHPCSAQHKPDKEEREAMAMSAEDVALRVEVKGQSDALEPVVWISTRPFLEGRSGSDKFLRASLDKITGKVFYQLYLSGVFPQSMRFSRITYLIAGNLQSGDVQRIYTDVSCQRYGCSYYEDYVVEFSRAALEALAAGDDGVYWQARLFGETVEGADVDVLRNETAGFLIAVDRAMSALPSPADGG